MGVNQLGVNSEKLNDGMVLRDLSHRLSAYLVLGVDLSRDARVHRNQGRDLVSYRHAWASDCPFLAVCGILNDRRLIVVLVCRLRPLDGCLLAPNIARRFVSSPLLCYDTRGVEVVNETDEP